jgi:hypothetical protein|tara:strand:+ start:655 stop:870 length:216 start_codon:yes stop_codon:yes gene_type:complete
MNDKIMQRVVRGTPMIIQYYNTAAILTLISIFFSGCAIIPNRNTITMNKTIELDERAIEKMNVGIRLEWIR